ncbi:MAG: O-antigen ligase family protein [Candidatus Kerfeldbacteria bacterium]|nr:O-antigen ligase family protein [Candidatus Kerfeldbacteria bacterium]
MKKLRRSEILIYCIIVLLPTYLIRFTLFGMPLNVLDIIIVGGFCLMLLDHHQSFRLGQWKYTMSSFVILGAISCLVATDFEAALGLYKSYIVEPVLVGMMVLAVRPAWHRVLYAFSVQLVFIAAVALIQSGTGYGIPPPWHVFGDDWRVTSVFAYPNAIGLLFAPIITLTIADSIVLPAQRRWLLPISILGLITIGLAKTQGAIIAVIAGSIFCLWRSRWRWLGLLLAASLLALALAWPTSRTVVLFQDTSGEVRLTLWQGTLNLLRHQPLFGAGLASFPEVYAYYKLDRHVELLLYPHNIFLDFWVELGLAGLIWLIVVVVGFFKRLWSVNSPSAIALMSSMVAIVVYGLVDVPYFKNDLAVVFWILITMSQVAADQ